MSNVDNSLIINRSSQKRNITDYHSIGLIIWRSLVQAQAGPRFYYSDLRFGVGRCFWFTKKELGWTTLQTPCAMKCNTLEYL